MANPYYANIAFQGPSNGNPFQEYQAGGFNYVPVYDWGSTSEQGDGTPTITGYRIAQTPENLSKDTGPAQWNGVNYDQYDPTGQYQSSGTFQGLGSMHGLTKYGWLLPILAAGGMAALGVGAGAAGTGVAEGVSGAAFGDAGLMYGGADAAAAGSLGGSAGAGAAGSGLGSVAYGAGPSAFLEGAGITGAGGAGAGALTGGSALTNTIAASGLGGLGSLLGPAATLLGAVAGSKGVKREMTGKQDIPDWLKPYVLGDGSNPGVLNYANTLLNQQMQPGYLQGYDQMRSLGQSLLSAPVKGNGFGRFFPGK